MEQSGTVLATGSSQIIRANIDYSVTIGHLTVASGTCGLGAESHFYPAQQGLNLSISYTNASGNITGDGISFYALTSGGTKILLSDPVSGGGSVSIIPVTGSGTIKWTWDDLPGYYTGFEAIMTFFMIFFISFFLPITNYLLCTQEWILLCCTSELLKYWQDMERHNYNFPLPDYS